MYKEATNVGKKKVPELPSFWAPILAVCESEKAFHHHDKKNGVRSKRMLEFHYHTLNNINRECRENSPLCHPVFQGFAPCHIMHERFNSQNNERKRFDQ